MRRLCSKRGGWRGVRGMHGVGLAVALSLLGVPARGASAGDSPEARRIASNARFEVLPAPSGGDLAPTLRAAASRLGSWTLEIAGVRVDGAKLDAILARGDSELVRAAREELRRPVDLADLLLFVDDVLREGDAGLRGREVYVPAGRARAAGLLLHPQEVFGTEPRRYGSRAQLEIDRPKPPRAYPRADDGEILGPRWTMRYPNPLSEAEMLEAVQRARPGSGLARRIASLVAQLREQGAEVALTSTVRRRERGYLMWGAFLLSRAQDAQQVGRTLTRLARANREWDLEIPIRWPHPGGWRATVEAAREMADTYEVVYATEEGARSSNHYTGVAVDLVAVGLPRRLQLRAPDGIARTFDLSDPSDPRDLSLSIEMIEWIEAHFELRKLRSDYPHWDDARVSDVARNAQRASHDED